MSESKKVSKQQAWQYKVRARPLYRLWQGQGWAINVVLQCVPRQEEKDDAPAARLQRMATR